MGAAGAASNVTDTWLRNGSQAPESHSGENFCWRLPHTPSMSKMWRCVTNGVEWIVSWCVCCPFASVTAPVPKRPPVVPTHATSCPRTNTSSTPLPGRGTPEPHHALPRRCPASSPPPPPPEVGKRPGGSQEPPRLRSHPAEDWQGTQREKPLIRVCRKYSTKRNKGGLRVWLQQAWTEGAPETVPAPSSPPPPLFCSLPPPLSRPLCCRLCFALRLLMSPSRGHRICDCNCPVQNPRLSSEESRKCAGRGSWRRGQPSPPHRVRNAAFRGDQLNCVIILLLLLPRL